MERTRPGQHRQRVRMGQTHVACNPSATYASNPMTSCLLRNFNLMPPKPRQFQTQAQHPGTNGGQDGESA